MQRFFEFIVKTKLDTMIPPPCYSPAAANKLSYHRFDTKNEFKEGNHRLDTKNELKEGNHRLDTKNEFKEGYWDIL